VVLSRRLRNRPCPCRSFYLCSRCRSICNRPYPCKSFGPYKRAFLSPCCQTDQTARPRAFPTKDSTPELSRKCLRASPQTLQLPLKLSCSSSLSLLAPIRNLTLFGVPDDRVQQRESSLVHGATSQCGFAFIAIQERSTMLNYYRRSCGMIANPPKGFIAM